MSRITFIVIQLSITVTLLHLVAVFFYLYWFFWWFDTLVHFIAGVWIGFVGAWLLYVAIARGLVSRKDLTRLSSVIISTGVAAIAALFWEIYEIQIGLAQYIDNYALDTTMDIVFGVVGGLVAGLWGYREYTKDPTG